MMLLTVAAICQPSLTLELPIQNRDGFRKCANQKTHWDHHTLFDQLSTIIDLPESLPNDIPSATTKDLV